jgi:threonyl-tRNA synthetase
LRKAGVRVEQDLRNEKLNYKIREAQMMKTPYMLIIGDREMEEGTVTVRKRNGENLPPMTLQEFADLVSQECEQGTA